MSSPIENSGGLQTPARRKNRNWIWVFVAFALLGVAAIAINWTYSAGQPLTEEKLRVARELWKKNRPTNYDLKVVRATTYASSDGSSGTTVDRIDLQVRNAKVVSFLLNGREPEPLINREGQRNVDEEGRQRASYDVDGLFDAMQEFMELDKRQGTRSFLRASFHKQDGHVTLFTRQVQGKRVPQIQVELKRVD